MELDLAQKRQQAHFMLDVLPEEKLAEVRTLLEVLVEPLSHSLATAPIDDEDLKPEMVEVLDRSRASLARGEGISHEDILSEFASD